MRTERELQRVVLSAQGDYWQRRLTAEIGFLNRLLEASEPDGGTLKGSAAVQETVARATSALHRQVEAEGSVSKATVIEFEEALKGLGSECKSYELICVGHAHIDMNWMWGFHETVEVTIDTMRTVLSLFERFPLFRFSQSQASVYQIIEKYAPQLVEPIRARIAEGRWEVTATQWVESDMNLPTGESLVRQMLYARRYLTERYGAPERAFEVVFLPDTFGHSLNVPELYAAAGVKYLYHCRGATGPHLSRWVAPSGRSVVVYREPRWYNTDVTSEVVEFLPSYARDTGFRTAMCVYGVGDHGGGPTIRDIERLIELQEWPLTPTVRFGGLQDYFATLDGRFGELPVFEGERNPVFTGCYSSQSRIKMANRTSERLLYETELQVAAARLQCGRSPYDRRIESNLREGWIRTLFSHFHDILPGSGVQLTREYALGSFQETAAASMAALSEALRRRSGQLDSTVDRQERRVSRSEGGGVGYAAERFLPSLVERGSGRQRSYAVHNQLQWKRTVPAEILVWDWEARAEDIECRDASGESLPHQTIESGTDPYWGHTFVRLRVAVEVPAFGSSVVLVSEREPSKLPSPYFPIGVENQLVEPPFSPVLENDHVRAVFDPSDLTLVSLVDKASGRELVGHAGSSPSSSAPLGGGRFRLVDEEAENMTAWIVGRYQRVRPVVGVVRVLDARIGAELLEQSISYEADLEQPRGGSGPQSRLRVRISLVRNEKRLRFEVDCDWLEIGARGKRVPQLQYALRAANDGLLRCDIPFGSIDREPAPLDRAANSFGSILPLDKTAPMVQITSESRQAFRLDEGVLSITLLRSSVDPDPYPEVGRHRMSFSVSVLDPGSRQEPSLSLREALEICNPCRTVSLGSREPEAETSGFLSVEASGCIVSAVKHPEPATWSAAEEGSGADEQERLIVRCYEVDGKESVPRLSLAGRASIAAAWTVDLHENHMEELDVDSGSISIPVPAHRVVTVELSVNTR